MTKHDTTPCDRFLEAIDDYVDGQLDPQGFADCDEHLAECDACRVELDAQRRLLNMAKALPRSIAPGRDLWPAIESSMRETVTPMPGRWRRRLVPFIAPLAAAAVGIFIAMPFAGDKETTTPIQTAPMDDFAKVEQEYLDAKAELLERLYAEQDVLPAATIATVEENLDIIENAVIDIRVALNENPKNPQLERILIATYKNQVDLLQQAVFLAHGS